MQIGIINGRPTVISIFSITHERSLKPKACKRASAFPAHITAFQDGFRITRTQKNKINLCFFDRLGKIDNDKKLKAK
jgi:hypothetical protein